jgi:hypothetical protein
MYFALGLIMIGLVDAYLRKPLVYWPLRAATVFGGLYLILESMLQHTWEGSEGALHIGGYGLVILALWGGLDRLASRSRGASLPVALALAAGGGAAVTANAATLTTGVLAGALAIAIGVFAIVAWWRGEVSIRGATSVFAPLLGFLWVIALVYADVPMVTMALLAAAPLAVWLGEVPMLSERPMGIAAARLVGALLLVVAGFVGAETDLLTPTSEESSVEESAEGDGDGSGSYVPYGDEGDGEGSEEGPVYEEDLGGGGYKPYYN